MWKCKKVFVLLFFLGFYDNKNFVGFVKFKKELFLLSRLFLLFFSINFKFLFLIVK